MAKMSAQAHRREITKRARIENPDERGEEMTAEEVAEFLKLKVSTVRQLASMRELPVYKLFRHLVFYRNEIANYRNLMLRGTR